MRTLLLVLQLVCVSAFAQDKKGADADRKLFMESGVTSNFVEHGVTQSGGSWALQAQFGYNISNIAHVGVWGSSVEYPDAGENLNLRGFFDVSFNLNSANTLIFRVDVNRYFQSTAHNGDILYVTDKVLGCNINLEQNTNWDGTGTPSTSYSFNKAFNIPYNLIFRPELGYTQLGAVGYHNYFDTRLTVGTNIADILAEAAISMTSAASQFHGRGNMFFIVSGSVRL